MSEFKDSLKLSVLEKTKYLFKNDYVNEFGGLDLSLQALKSGTIDMQTLKDFCVKFAKNKNGDLVLKFSEKYGLPIPPEYKDKIKEMDILVDEINAWVRYFVKDENSKNIDELFEIVQKANSYIKDARNEDKPYK